MKKKSKIFWAYAPIVFLVLGVVLLLVSGTQTVGGMLTGTGQIISTLAIVCTVLSVVITYISMVIFIVAACKNPVFSTGKKVFWGIMLYLFNMFAYPVYLHKYILKEQGIE